jgi:hypothetical protein
MRMDAQIAASHGDAGWVADYYGDELAALRAAGDTVGLHPHGWRWLPESGRWLADHGNPAWIEHCIRLSFETYRTAFGETCRFVRFGDRFLSAASIRLAAELGARYDLTVEPGAPELSSMHGAAASGRIRSMRDAPRRPYRPSVDDPLRAAIEGQVDAGLWMIPLTSLNPDAILSPWRRVGRRVRHHGRPLHRPAPLFAAAWAAAPFWEAVDEFLAESASPYLAFAIRSDVPLRPDQIGPIEEKLAALRVSPLVERLLFTTPDAIVGSPNVSSEATS